MNNNDFATKLIKLQLSDYQLVKNGFININTMAMDSNPLTPEVKEYLTKQYYDTKFPRSFSGVDKCYTEIKMVVNIS